MAAPGPGSISLGVYSKTRWNDRVEAVFAEPEEGERKVVNTLKPAPAGGRSRCLETVLETSGCLDCPGITVSY